MGREAQLDLKKSEAQPSDYQGPTTITFFFMALGAFFGIFEEVIPLVPIIIALAFSLGWDSLTGLGMSIVANRFAGVRATLCHDLYTARMSREHNDSNLLVLGGRLTGKGLAQEILKVWLEAAFQGGNHERRLGKIKSLERRIGPCSEK